MWEQQQGLTSCIADLGHVVSFPHGKSLDVVLSQKPLKNSRYKVEKIIFLYFLNRLADAVQKIIF